MESDGPPDAGYSFDIPPRYLDSVEVQAYHLDVTLAVEQGTFSGLVRIPVHISGPPRRVFYLHSAGLRLSHATVNGVNAAIVKDRVSMTGATRLEVPAEAAVRGESVIEVQFLGAISRWRTEGISLLGQGHLGNLVDKPAVSQVSGKGAGGGGGKGGETSFESINSSKSEASSFPAGGVLGTHLEPTHARDLFPCVDLPCAKAVFHLTLRGVPRHLQAISNTPVFCVEDKEEGQEGDAPAAAAARRDDDHGPHAVKTITFQPTPRMPTYIFGFWIGDFHCITTYALATEGSRASALMCCGTLVPEFRPSLPPSPSSQPVGGGGEDAAAGAAAAADAAAASVAVQINVHVLRTVGLEGAEFVLGLARRAFELFSRLFAVRFPLPKLDLLGLSRMHGLGMENFGAITLLEDYLLVTADTPFVRRRRIARLVCHEVCHQWYGDIVTPQSFDELWLKEGLARFFEYVAVDALDSSYRVWTNFMSEVFFQAMLADAQQKSHPVVQQHNGDIASIMQSFDTITYCKGASVLRMLCCCVGPARFLEGTRRFVVDHQYACATQEDLWKAVQGVCDRDGVALNVRDLMQPWLTCAMFPLLRVRMGPAANILTIVQQPFSFCLSPPSPTPAAAAAKTTIGGGVTAKAAWACPEGPGAVAGEGGSRSTKVLRTGATTNADDRSPPDAANHAPPGAPGAVGAQESDPTAGEDSAGGGLRSEAPVAESATPGADAEHVDEGGFTRWAVPLRIRVANGSQDVVPKGGAARSPADRAEGWGQCGVGPEGRPGEKMYRFLMTEESTFVALGGLSRGEPTKGTEGGGIAGTGGDAAGGGAEEVNVGDEEGGECPAEGRPYLIINDGHSGFFTVQYECERSWALALAAVEEGVMDECETMGFVYDLILGLHKGVLADREAARWGITGDRGELFGACYCDVPRLLSRLQDVVRLLARDRGHPAWCTGQLFIWELLIMCTSNALRDVYMLSRRRRELALARQRAGSTEHNGLSDSVGRTNVRNAGVAAAAAAAEAAAPSPPPPPAKAAAGGREAGDRPVGGEVKSPASGSSSARRIAELRFRARQPGETGSPPLAAEADGKTGQADQRRRPPPSSAEDVRDPAAAAGAAGRGEGGGADVSAAFSSGAWSALTHDYDAQEAAQQRLSRIAADVNLALEEVEEHARWHGDRVASGVERADEALQSLRAMGGRLDRCRAQLIMAAKI